MRASLTLAGLVTFLLCVVAGPALAATFTVNSTADTVDVNPGNGLCADAAGQCTLRAAIMEANAFGGPDIITLPAGTYTLTIPGSNENAAATGDLDVTGDLTINGAGAASTAIDGSALDRVLHVLAGTVNISGLTIRNGSPPGGSFGGGVLNGGTLTLNSSTLSGSFGPTGFAIFGGGISNSGTLILSNSTVSNNSGYLGGGIYNGGTLTLSNSTVSSNSGIQGAGIYNSSATMTLINITLSGNSVSGNPGASAIHATAGASSTFRNTIVADTISGNNCFTLTPFTSIGFNLSSDASCAFSGTGDLNSTNPLLGPLASNGGPTATHALLPGSPAIDAVPIASCTVSTDQRGVSRPQGADCDTGAFEVASAPACVAPPAGMVGWWPMDDIAGSASLPGATSLQDIIGGNHATPFASPVGAPQGPQPVPGVVGGAMHFPKFGNGLSGARVSPQGALATVGAANFTIDAWVQVPPAAANVVHYIVNKFDTGQNRGYALYVVSPGVAGNERLEFKWGDGTTVSSVQTIVPLTTGQWHHVAVTFARNVGGFALDIRLYVDGVQQGQQTGNPPGLGSLVNFVFLEIGWQPGTLDAPISIDELEIFNVALPASDIQAIYNAGGAGKCACTTGGQSVDLTVAATGAVAGAGSGTAVTASSPLTVNYSIQGCSGRELFLILNAPSAFPTPVYWNGSAWVPIPSPLSLITPFVIGGPATSNGVHTLFSGSVPSGTYDVFLVCDLFVNGHLDVTFPPLCLSGAFDHLPLTVP